MWGNRLAVVLVLVAGAVLAVPRRRVPRGTRRRAASRMAPRVRRALLAGVGVGAVGAVLAAPAVVCVALAGIAALLVRLVPSRRRELDATGMRRLAGILDLIATCLDAGLTVAAAITAVLRVTASAAAGDGAPADPIAAHRSDLAEVAALLALGAEPASAWRPVARHRDLAGLASAARRSAVGGVRLADAVRESAADLRGRCRAAGSAAAARAGVAMTAPLAICFLPAFVCLGLAPVIVGMVSTLHIW